MSPPVVYAVRPGDQNEELRYSLRSLTNIDHDRVIIAGHKPGWVTNVQRIHAPTHSGKYLQTAANWTAACHVVNEPFLMFNDDFFALKPTTVQPWHRGPLDDVIAYYQRQRVGNYTRGMIRTRDLLHRWGIKHPLSYGLHVPMLIDPTLWNRMIKRTVGQTGPLHLRTIYGNMHNIGGTQIDDPKISGTRVTIDKAWVFASTDDKTFASHQIGLRIRKMFPKPSPYETPPLLV